MTIVANKKVELGGTYFLHGKVWKVTSCLLSPYCLNNPNNGITEYILDLEEVA